MGCWVTRLEIFTNAQTLADSPSGAHQYTKILKYETVGNRNVLQLDSEHVNCCWYSRHVLVGALVEKLILCGGNNKINHLVSFGSESSKIWLTFGSQKTPS